MAETRADIQRFTKTADGHVEYFIKVLHKGREWAVRKRYKDFLKLEKLLLKHCGIRINTQIPPKAWWDRFNMDLLAWRKSELQKYLTKLLNSASDIAGNGFHCYCSVT